MYYTNGNYEAFARPRKPQGVGEKQAWLVGGGLASLAAAAFLVRDAQMDGSRIHILEDSGLPGGACDGLLRPDVGFVIRGGREMENHYECLWDLFRSVPSLEVEDASVLDEFYWLNHDDPNCSKNRATLEQGASADTKNRFELSDEAALEWMRLFFTPDEALCDKTIDDVLSEEFYQSNFWLYWQTMFAFEKWHSALEMKLYLQRFLHHIGGLPDLSALKFTRYNQYESLILPLVKFLEDSGVQFEYGVKVTNVLFHFLPGKKVAHQIVLERGGKTMKDCTGAEICMEWLYHLGVPESEIETLAAQAASTVPCMMPYVTAFFMPRAAGDRPDIVPEGCVNFAFLGQFAETPRDTIFTTEYSVRTAMEAVYTLLGIERGVPEVYASVYDVRCLLNAAHYLLDGRRLTEMKLPLPYKMALHAGLEKLRGTTLDELLVRYELV